jgi:hypothetical protein
MISYLLICCADLSYAYFLHSPDCAITSGNEYQTLHVLVFAPVRHRLAETQALLHLGVAQVNHLGRVQLTPERVEKGGAVVVARLCVANDQKRVPFGRPRGAGDPGNVPTPVLGAPAVYRLGRDLVGRDDELGKVTQVADIAHARSADLVDSSKRIKCKLQNKVIPIKQYIIRSRVIYVKS